MPADPDFFEDDDPLDEIEAAFDSGTHGLTGRPDREPVDNGTNFVVPIIGYVGTRTVAATVRKHPA